ncbi:unnamed protein product [Boreogadus saida]
MDPETLSLGAAASDSTAAHCHFMCEMNRNRAGLLDRRRTLLSSLSSVASLQWKGSRGGEELKPSAHDPPKPQPNPKNPKKNPKPQGSREKRRSSIPEHNPTVPGIQREEKIIYPRTRPTNPREPERRADHLSLNTTHQSQGSREKSRSSIPEHNPTVPGIQREEQIIYP